MLYPGVKKVYAGRQNQAEVSCRLNRLSGSVPPGNTTTTRLLIYLLKYYHQV
jgi:hypothetical protein